MKKHTCSLSGGNTSTVVLPTELIKKYGKDNIEFIFCDTGAETPETYDFVRNAEKYHGIKITCLKLVLPRDKGVGARYLECTTKDIKRDYFAWKQLTSKYGNPFIPGGKICTDQMKTAIYKLYCEEKYGKSNYYTWLGYRAEEGNRIFGKVASNALGKAGLNNKEKTDFYLSCLNGDVDSQLDFLYPSMFKDEADEVERNKIKSQLELIKTKGFRFLSELLLIEKNEVDAIASAMPFKLGIDRHLTNCTFCPEKPHATVMLAIKDRPEDAFEFMGVVESDDVPNKIKRDGTTKDKLVMYRGGVTFRQLYNKAMKLSREEILKMSNIGIEIAKKNPCSSGECSPFTDDLNQIEIDVTY